MTGSGWAASRLSDALIDVQKDISGQRETTVYILCDPILGDPAASWLDENLDVPEPQRISCALGRDMQPYLLAVPQGHAGELLLQASVERALDEAEYASTNVPAPRSVCAWLVLETSASPDFCRELARKARSPFAGDKESAGLFRYWDPRVFVHLPRVLGASFENWFGFPVRWRWIDGSGALREMRITPTTDASPTSTHYIADAMRESLENLQYINQVLVHTGLIAQGREADHGVVVERHVRQARRLGCATSRDIVMYAATSLQIGAHFEGAPCLKALMQPFVAQQVAFAQIAMGVPDALWAQAQSELASARHLEDGVMSQ